MKKNWRHLLRLSPLLLLSVMLTGCGKKGVSALIPMGEIAREQAWLMLFSFCIMLVVVAVVVIIFIYVLVRFRARRGQEDVIPKQVEGHTVLEILWTVIPIILLIILAVPTIAKTVSEENTHVGKNNKNVVQINVTANQYWWEFQYPDQKITTAQDLVIPKGKTVILKLTSKDVIHAFWVPALAGKIDANPGQTTKLKFKADHEGTYRGRCAELCGSSHALMYFNVKAVSDDEYNQWIKAMKTAMKNGPAAPTTDDAKKGEDLFSKSCMSCHAVGSKGGNIGPNLTDFADRENVAGILDHNKKNLEKWIKNPSAVKPGANMPSRGASGNLTDDQIKQIADYLFTLSVKQ